MIIFVIIYVVIAIVGFIVGLIIYIKRNNRRKYNNAAEKIIRDDLLGYSLKNPYIMDNSVKPPLARRVMIGLTIKAAGKKHSYVFDPAKRINIGRDDKNQIIIYDASVSAYQACIYVSGGGVCVYNTGTKNPITLRRGASSRNIRPKEGFRLRDGDILLIQNYKIKVKLFVFDINHK
ncbi:MAG: FHA domain-containing protein [Oscillospiraceae bacterium]|nr:FHA domain-containing protein [Oscillospiraceae bacterium]